MCEPDIDGKRIKDGPVPGKKSLTKLDSELKDGVESGVTKKEGTNPELDSDSA